MEEILYSLPYDPVYKSLQIFCYPSKSSFPYVKKQKARANYSSKAFSVPSIPHNERKFGYFETNNGKLRPVETLLEPIKQDSVVDL